VAFKRRRTVPDSGERDRSAVAKHLADAVEAAGCQEELARELARRGWGERFEDGGDAEDAEADPAITERVEAMLREMRVEAPRRAEEVKRFIAACCEVSKEGRATGGDLYQRYLAWAQNRRGAAWTIVQFSRALGDNGYGRDPSGATQGRNKIWTGIALRPWKGPPNAPDGGGVAADRTISQMADERRARRKRTRPAE